MPIKTCHHPRHQDHKHNLKPKQDHIQMHVHYKCMTHLHLPCSNSAPMAFMHKHVNACS